MDTFNSLATCIFNMAQARVGSILAKRKAHTMSSGSSREASGEEGSQDECSERSEASGRSKLTQRERGKADHQEPSTSGGKRDLLTELMVKQQAMLQEIALACGRKPSKRPVEADSSDSDNPQDRKRSFKDTPDHGESDAGDDLDKQIKDYCLDSEEEASDKEAEDAYSDVLKFFIHDEKLAPPLSKPTTDLAAAAMKSAMPGFREKESLEGILRPSNCDMLIVPKTNSAVWKGMKPATRERDADFQKIQAIINKGIVPVLQLMDDLRERKEKKALGLCIEAFRMFAMASTHVSQYRRQCVGFGAYLQAACYAKAPSVRQSLW